MRRKLIWCTLITCLCFIGLQAQPTNPCGVKAVISPAGDSVLPGPQALNLYSASVNATSYRFMFDDWVQPMNTPITYGINAGLTKIRLIAYNGACSDTTTVWYFLPGKFPTAADNASRIYGYANRNHTPKHLLHANSGGYLLSGQREASSFFYEKQQGLLIKTKEEGCTEWAKKIDGNFAATIRATSAAADGGFFIMAEIDYRTHIVKIDANGNQLWSKRLELWGGPAPVVGYAMEPLPDGGVVISGQYPSVNRPLVVRLNSAGSIVWQRELDNNFTSNFDSKYITLKGDHLYMSVNGSYNNLANYDAFLFKLDVNTGKSVWVKKYTNTNGHMFLRDIIDTDSTLLVGINTPSGIPNTASMGGFMHLDTAGQVLQASVMAEPYVPNSLMSAFGAGNTQLVRSGKTFYLFTIGGYTLSLQPYSSVSHKMIKIDSNLNYSWIRNYGGAGAERYYYASAAPKDGLAVTGDPIKGGYSPQSLGWMMSIKNIDSAGGNPAASCYFYPQNYVVAPQYILPEEVALVNESSPAYASVTRDVNWEPFYPEMRFSCPDYVDSCSFLKISGPTEVCNISDVLTYESHKNKACGQPTNWEVPAGVQIISQNGTSLSVKLPAFGRYVIYGSNPLSCSKVVDSLVVIAASKTPPLDLGSDRSICVGNSLKLHAGPKFLAYEWQDGSADSLFSVTAPGQYHVKTTDSCGNLSYDTINITAAPPIPFSVGPDRVKCNDDTVRLQAPAGFMNYAWSNNYNINVTNTAQVIVQPAVDTVYTVMAEKTPGCFAYDTVRVFVHRSPAINFGPDVSFCQGDSVVLDAGAGFQTYNWSNGIATQRMKVTTVGTYSIKATTLEGCSSYDTVKVLNVFSNPVVSLGSNNVLCVGSERLLKVNTYSSYLWDDGSTSATRRVNSLGTYYVTVSDNNHCVGSDTVRITRMATLPSAFLPADTSLCTYGRVELKPSRSYNSYLWSNGAISSSINVSSAGVYWLQVTDENNCTGRDSIVYTAKDCIIGLYVPNAFSPNRDGKNDVFRPVLLGNIKQFKFIIYNRYGQAVFTSTDPLKGWDGRNGTYEPSTNVYVWACMYQLEGEAVKSAKGTVLLVK